MSDITDIRALAISRLATEFREAENLISYIRALLVEANTLEQVYCDILEKRWLDTAEGVQLDIIGAIVGQGRTFIDAEIFEYFGFHNNAQANSFGTLTDSAIGGRFRYIGEPIIGLRQLSDEEYRVFIKARIARNMTSSTPENIIDQVKYIFSIPLVLLVDGDLCYEISIGKTLSLNEKAILTDTDIIPKTAGVRLKYMVEFDSTQYFGFQGLPNALGFGSINNANLGGLLGNLIF